MRGAGPNAIGVTLGLVGDQWNLLIVQQAFLGRRRFGDFIAALPISNAVLSGRLNGLVAAGVLEADDGYVLTEAGRALWPVLLSIWAWEARWADAAGLPAMIHSGGCGQAFAPVLVCGACSGSAGVLDMRARWGPSGGWVRSVPAASTRRHRGTSPVDLGLFPDTLSLIGNRWALALLGASLLGLTRFAEFERALKAPPTVVADRLRTFVEVGALATDESGAYRLTDKGQAMLPTVLLAVAWGGRWHGAPEGPAVLVKHVTCGSVLESRLVCDRCRVVLVAAEVAVGNRP